MRKIDNHWKTHWHVAIHCALSDRSAIRARKRSICIYSLLCAAATADRYSRLKSVASGRLIYRWGKFATAMSI
jgi:hypothetical protein